MRNILVVTQASFCRGFRMVPSGDTTFVPHNCFTTREANAFYSLDLVQPVVHPYELWGPLKDCPWYNFWSVFSTRQWSEIEDYIKIFAISGEHYDPYDTDKRLPKQHRQFTVCTECGRQAQECWAMGSMVNFNPPFDQPSYVACVYCSTYRALVAFMDTDMKWFDALQLRVGLYSKIVCVACWCHAPCCICQLLAIPTSCCMHYLFVGFCESCCMPSAAVHQYAYSTQHT